MKLRNSAALLLAGALCACAGLPERVPSGAADETAWQSRSARLARLTTWEVEGRVGVVTAKDGGSGSLDWKQQGETLVFDFVGPLGSGAIHVEGDADALRVRSSRGDDFLSFDPEADFAARLNMPLPVNSMRYWLLGLPDPHASFDKQADARGELVSLMQRGWQVQYQAYTDVDGYSLPVKLSLQREAVRIKLVINAWTLGASLPAPP